MFPRTALVTGGASGIGAAIVDLLRGEGADVQVLDLADGFDVSVPRAWETVGAVELACLNAGVTTGEQDVSRVSDDAYERILGANLDGVVFGVRRLANVMEPGSAIVATASLAGLVPSPDDPIYTLTKHAVIGFVRSVAPQLEERGNPHQRGRARFRRDAADRLRALHRCRLPAAAAGGRRAGRARRCAQQRDRPNLGRATRARAASVSLPERPRPARCLGRERLHAAAAR